MHTRTQLVGKAMTKSSALVPGESSREVVGTYNVLLAAGQTSVCG